jgi:hypothetical protein
MVDQWLVTFCYDVTWEDLSLPPKPQPNNTKIRKKKVQRKREQ